MTDMGIYAREPDLTREYKTAFSWCPSHSVLASIRAYQRYSDSRNPFFILARQIADLRHGFWNIVTGADMSINARIGGGLLLPYPNLARARVTHTSRLR